MSPRDDYLDNISKLWAERPHYISFDWRQFSAHLARVVWCRWERRSLFQSWRVLLLLHSFQALWSVFGFRYQENCQLLEQKMKLALLVTFAIVLSAVDLNLASPVKVSCFEKMSVCAERCGVLNFLVCYRLPSRLTTWLDWCLRTLKSSMSAVSTLTPMITWSFSTEAPVSGRLSEFPVWFIWKVMD